MIILMIITFRKLLGNTRFWVIVSVFPLSGLVPPWEVEKKNSGDSPKGQGLEFQGRGKPQSGVVFKLSGSGSTYFPKENCRPSTSVMGGGWFGHFYFLGPGGLPSRISSSWLSVWHSEIMTNYYYRHMAGLPEGKHEPLRLWNNARGEVPEAPWPHFNPQHLY